MSTAPSPRRGPCAPSRGLSRRTLLRAGLSAPLAGGPAAAARLQARRVPAVVWPRTCYRRFLVDTHSPDWHPDFLARFDAACFVGAMARAGVQALMFYCNSHVGLALWRTKLGKPHANLRGRDLFGEIVAECRRR